EVVEMSRQRAERAPAATKVQDGSDQWCGRNSNAGRVIVEEQPISFPEGDEVRRPTEQGQAYFFLSLFLSLFRASRSFCGLRPRGHPTSPKSIPHRIA